MRCTVCGKENLPEARFCASCGAPLPGASQPAVPIGVGASYSWAWGRLWKNFAMLLVVGIIYVLISSVSWVFDRGQAITGIGFLFGLLTVAYSVLLVNPLGYGVSYAYLKGARDETINVGDMFAVFRNYWNAVGASLLVAIIVVAGVILLIVPGIIFACKLAFVPYLVVDRKMDAISAIKESWRMTNGHAWTVFLMGLLAIPIFIAGIIALGVGVIISIMWISLAFASLYYAVSRSTPPQTKPVA